MYQVLFIALAAGIAVFGASQWFPGAPEARPAAAEPAQAVDARLPLPLEITEAWSPNIDDRPAGTAIDTIIVHDTESPGVSKAATIANHFLNPRSQVSAHYIIGKAGEIIQCVPDEKRAWHAGPSKFKGREKVNDFSVGIELVNAQTGRDPFTEAQYASLIALTADLMSRHAIPMENITGHRHVTNYPKIKHDPADNFDWERYRQGVAETLKTRVVVRRVLNAQKVAKK